MDSSSSPPRRRQHTGSPSSVANSNDAPASPWISAWGTVRHHIQRHVGVGVLCAVAYFDPGNWSVDLAAGSQFGYKLLCVVLAAGLGAVLLQILASKLGCVTGLDLAAHCRLLLNNHPRFPRLVRWLFLYPLYIFSEVAIISTDLAELLGSAIGISLIFPQLPLWAGLLLTTTDVLIILAIGNPTGNSKRPVRLFELIIMALVAIVLVSFIILTVKVGPKWSSVFEGFLPSKSLVEPSGLYASIGILGATVMPHGLYLGSYLASQDRVSSKPPASVLPGPVVSRSQKAKLAVKKLLKVQRTEEPEDDPSNSRHTPYHERANNPLSFVRAHLTHGIVDIVFSLLGFAVLINSAILVVAAAVFFHGELGPTQDQATVGLFEAHDLIASVVGKPIAFIFALALLCSGQTSSITATLAGQIVSEGFIEWRVSPFLRRILTRSLGLIPSLAVAVALGKPGINSLLVISQVILSIVLPFVMLPLVWLTSSKLVMRVKKPRVNLSDNTLVADDPHVISDAALSGSTDVLQQIVEELTQESLPTRSQDETNEKEICQPHVNEKVVEREIVEEEEEWIDYSNGWFLTCMSYLLWLIVVTANGYLLVTLYRTL